MGIFAHYSQENETCLTKLTAENEAYFGEMGLVESMPRSATAVALSDVRVETITGKDFGAFFTEHPERVYAVKSLSTSENMKWRIRSNFQQGLAWNPTLLGYRYEDGVFVIQPEEAEIVRQIYDCYLDGMGATAIAKMLNESGKVSRFGNALGQRSIMLILQNYTYTGNLLLQKTFSENHLTKKKRYNEGQLPMYHIQNSHEAIIPLEKYNAVQAEIKRRAEK